MSNRFRSFGRFLLTLLLALSFFLSACGGVAPEPAPDVEIEQHPVSTEERAEGEIEPILAEITNVLDPPTVERLQEFRDDGTLVFPLDTPDVKELTKGDVIVSRDTESAPNGFLLKVVSVEETGNNLVVRTEQAQLEEAFVQAEISDIHTLTQDDVASESSGGTGVLLSQRPAPGREIYVKVDNVIFEDKESGAKVMADGSITLTPEFDFRLVILGGKLREFRLVNRTTQTSQLELSAKMEFRGGERLLIKSIPFKPRLILVGNVPVVYRPVLDVYVGVNGTVSTGISTSMTHTVVYETGVVYDGEWREIDKEPVHDWDFDPLSVTAKLSARVFAAPRLEIRFYGVAGPYAEIEGSLGLSVNLVSDPWWQLFGRVEAKAGIEFKVLGHVIAGYEERLYFHEWIIDQADTPAPAPVEGQKPAPMEGQKPASVEGQIVFASDRGGDAEIYVMNADGTGLQKLINSTDGEAYEDPAVSLDGTRIAFNSNRDGASEIYVMNMDGTGLTRLTDTPNGTCGEPAWSPDGSKIAFRRWIVDQNWEIYVMNADGTGLTLPLRYRDRNEHSFSPSWSPDGTRIAFSYGDEIRVMNADGMDLTQLTDSRDSNWNGTWAPDGSKIAFTSSRDENAEIYVMNADGSQQTRLTYHPADDFDPVWAPDGSKIAFISERDGNREIYVMNADGSQQTRLTYHPADDFDPAWLPVP